MRSAETAGDLDRDVQRFLERRRTALEPRLEGFSFAQLHAEEGSAVVAFPDLVDGADVRVVQAGGRAGLPEKALLVPGVVSQSGGQELERDGAAELEVARPVHDPHAAGSQAFENLEMGNKLSLHRGREKRISGSLTW